MEKKKEIVCAFAGAAHTGDKWKRDITPGISCKSYADNLLSDHVPVDFNYTDSEGCVHHVLFANCASLLDESRGVVDNSKDFGNITFDDLQKWSDALVDPLIRGTIRMINTNIDVLKKFKTWKPYQVIEYNEDGTTKKDDHGKIKVTQKNGFEKIIQDYDRIKGNPVPKGASSSRHARARLGKFAPGNKQLSTSREVLAALSDEVWFRSDEDAAKAKRDFPELVAEPAFPQKSVPVAPPVKVNEAPKTDAKQTFELLSNTSGDFKKETWTVSANGKITTPNSDITTSFTRASCGEARKLEKRLRCYVPTEVNVSFKNRKADCSFSTDTKDGNREQLGKFLKCIEKIKKRKGGTVTTIGNESIDTVLKELALRKSRRMAQREFSNRRDSPVMVRLLEEIIAAQNK